MFAGESGMPLNPDALSSRYEKALEAGGCAGFGSTI